MAKHDDIAIENLNIYRYARVYGHWDYLIKASQCEAYTRGEQWSAEVKDKLARKRKPALTVNKILPAVSTLLAEQISRAGDISFRASSGGNPDTARILDKLWINFCQTQQYSTKESTTFLNGVITSRGYFDLRLSFDESMQGEPVLTVLNPKDVILMPEDSYDSLDPDDWSGVLLSKWLTPIEIENMYDVDSAEVSLYAYADTADTDFVSIPLRNQFGYASALTYPEAYYLNTDDVSKLRRFRVFERQSFEFVKVECFVDPVTGEVRRVPDGWDRERIGVAMAQYGYNIIKQKVRRPRWDVSVGTMSLHSAPSPYKHLTVIPYFPFLVGSKPVGVVEQLIDPQNLLNKTLSQELHIVAGIANSGFKVRTGALANMTPEQLQERGGEDGLVIEVTGDLNAVDKIQPNQVPTGLDRLSYKAGEALQDISLVNSSLQGLNRADESYKAIERKASMGSSALTPLYTSLDHTRRIVARNWLDLVQEYVTEPRMYHISGPAKNAEAQQIQVNQPQEDGSFLNDLTLGEYAISVSTVQARDNFDLDQFNILMQMVREGAPIPWSEIIANLSIIQSRDELVTFLKQHEGAAPPTEAQQQQEQLNQRLLAAQAADKESSAAVKQAQAQKAMALARKEEQPDASLQLEIAKQQHAADIKQQEAQAKLEALSRKAEIDAQIAMMKLENERTKMQEELEFARQKYALELDMLRAKLQEQIAKASLTNVKADDSIEPVSNMGVEQ